MQNKTVNWGIISTARIANTFAADIAQCANSHLYAVASRNSKSAEEFAVRHRIPKAFGSYESMLEDPNIDAVYVATPHSLHCDNVMQALKAGKHVLCEKPATTSLSSLEHMIAESKAQSCFFMEAMWTYFLPPILQAKKWVESGRIGKLRHIKASFGFPMIYNPNSREYDKELGGGCLLDMGIYPIAFDSLFFETTPPPSVTNSHFAPNGVEDDVSWTYQRGEVLSTLHTSFRGQLNNDAWLIGSEGTIHIPDFWAARESFLYKAGELVEHQNSPRCGSGFEFEIAHSSEKILSGKTESNIVSHSVSRNLMQKLNDLSLLINGETSSK